MTLDIPVFSGFSRRSPALTSRGRSSRKGSWRRWTLLAIGGFCACTSRADPSAFEGHALRREQLRDGVIAHVLREGRPESRAAASGDYVRLHYRTRLTDGELLDGGRKPLGFFVGASDRMIPGLHIAVTGMRPGELRRVEIPSKQAYGGRSVGPIPADADLRMDLEMIEVSPP